MGTDSPRTRAAAGGRGSWILKDSAPQHGEARLSDAPGRQNAGGLTETALCVGSHVRDADTETCVQQAASSTRSPRGVGMGGPFCTLLDPANPCWRLSGHECSRWKAVLTRGWPAGAGETRQRTEAARSRASLGAFTVWNHSLQDAKAERKNRRSVPGSTLPCFFIPLGCDPQSGFKTGQAEKEEERP